MKRLKKGVFLILSMLMVFCMGTISVASANDNTAYFLSKSMPYMQGKWYDENGNVFLDVEGPYINGCQVIGCYNLAGAKTTFGALIRLAEAGGYRDVYIDADLGGNHAHIIWNYEPTCTKGTWLIRTPKAQYDETVSGIGLDMTEKEVLAKLGKPDKIGKHGYGNWPEWRYKKLGLGLTMLCHRVEYITLYQKGTAHFDRSGLNCNNTIPEFQKAYNFEDVPHVGEYGGHPVGRSEFIRFTNYPNSIELTFDGRA